MATERGQKQVVINRTADLQASLVAVTAAAAEGAIADFARAHFEWQEASSRLYTAMVALLKARRAT